MKEVDIFVAIAIFITDWEANCEGYNTVSIARLHENQNFHVIIDIAHTVFLAQFMVTQPVFICRLIFCIVHDKKTSH